MKKIILFLIFCTSLTFLNAQETTRVEINGRINVNAVDKEGITVFNRSSNNGVTTDDTGAFKIDVALNDVLVFGALQFEDFSISIDERIMESRQVSVRLVEQINKLDEVLVLPYDLSGNLKVDAESVRTYNVDMDEVYKGAEDNEDYKFSADENTKIDNPFVNENRLKNGLNFVNIFKAITKDDNSKPKTKAEKFRASQSPLAAKYNPEFLKSNFNIPTEKSEAFIDFVENKGYDKTLLTQEKEIYLIQFLQEQSKLFLASKN